MHLSWLFGCVGVHNNMDEERNCTSMGGMRQRNDSEANHDVLLSPMQTHFLVVFALAAVNVILGAVYAFIHYKRRQGRYRYRGQGGHVVGGHGHGQGQGRQWISMDILENNGAENSRRKMSTNLVLAVGQKKQSARRISNAFL